jgi:hypothetical protein
MMTDADLDAYMDEDDDFYWGGAFDCSDCGIHTAEYGEYYMVHDELWRKHGAGDGMLCLSCLTGRIGRELTAQDFTNAPINDECEYVERLRAV